MKQIKKNLTKKTLCSVLVTMFAVCLSCVLTISAQVDKPKPVGQIAIQPKPATLNMTTSVKFRTVGKLLMTITVLETRENYQPRMTREQFDASVLSGMGDRKVPDAFKNFLGAAFQYHQRNLTADQVYDTESGEAFVKVRNELMPEVLRVHKKGMSEIELGNLLMPSTSRVSAPVSSELRAPWKNWIRKIIDIILDELFD